MFTMMLTQVRQHGHHQAGMDGAAGGVFQQCCGKCLPQWVFLDTLFCWGKCRPQEIKCLLFKVSIKDQSVFNSLKLNSLLNQYFKYVPRSLSNTKPPKVIRNFFLKMDVCFSGIIQLGLFRWNGEPSTWESSWHSGAYVRSVDILFALNFEVLVLILQSIDRSWSCFHAILLAGLYYILDIQPDVLIIFVPGYTVFKICPMWLYYTYYICSRLHC